jgi:hypothetical protein
VVASIASSDSLMRRVDIVVRPDLVGHLCIGQLRHMPLFFLLLVDRQFLFSMQLFGEVRLRIEVLDFLLRFFLRVLVVAPD